MKTKNLQDKHGNPVADSLRFNIDIGVPKTISTSAYEAWSRYLINEPTWSDFDTENNFFGNLDQTTRLFISSHFCLWQTFFELGRLPVFDIFQIHSLTLKDPEKNIYSLEVDFLKLDGIPLNAYQIPMIISLKITQWISQHSVNQKNLNYLYKVIDQEIIQAMHRIVPGGHSTIPLLKSAYQLGIPFMHLSLGIYQLGWGSRAQRLDRSSSVADAIMGAKLSQNKVSTTQLLKTVGLPASHHFVAYGEQEAFAAAQELGYPVVVKPADQDRGEGITVGVEDQESLRHAFVKAQRVSKSKQVIVERHVSGVCHRFLIVGDQLLYVVKRKPMGVLGDGVHSVQELVNLELTQQSQKSIWTRSKLQAVDELAIQAIEAAGLTLESIPHLDQYVPLRMIESTQWGGIAEDMTDVVHPDNIQAAIQAARLLNLHISGVDIISTDIRVPWHQNGAIINEVNYAPLLGGAEISRSYLPKFFKMLFPESSKIPIEILDNQALAYQRRDLYKQQNLRTYFVSKDGIEDPWGQTVIMPITDLRLRIKALMSRSDVDAIVALI